MLVNTIPFRSGGKQGAKGKQFIDYLIDRSTNGWLFFLGGSAKKSSWLQWRASERWIQTSSRVKRRGFCFSEGFSRVKGYRADQRADGNAWWSTQLIFLNILIYKSLLCSRLLGRSKISYPGIDCLISWKLYVSYDFFIIFFLLNITVWVIYGYVYVHYRGDKVLRQIRLPV